MLNFRFVYLFVYSRTTSEEPYSSIWDIDDPKARQAHMQPAPPPMQNTHQAQNFSSYANIARQTNNSASQTYARPVQTLRQNESSRRPMDTQMDLERAAMEQDEAENAPTSSTDSYWSSNLKKNIKISSANSAPVCVEETPEYAFTPSNSGSSSQYSSLESLDDNAQTQISSQTTTSKAPTLIVSSDFSGYRKVVTQLSTDKNNNVLSSKNTEGPRNIVRAVDLSSEKSSSKQRMPNESKGQLVSKPPRARGFGNPVDPKVSQESCQTSAQKQSDNSKMGLQCKTAVDGQIAKPTETWKTSDKGGFGRPRPDTKSSSVNIQITKDAEPEANSKKGFGKPKSNYLNHSKVSNKVADLQPVPQNKQFNSENSLKKETEDWEDEIEDFPSNVKQTYSYGVDHVKFPVTKNRIISEKELTNNYKKEIHIRKTEAETKKAEPGIVQHETIKTGNPKADVPAIHITSPPTGLRTTGKPQVVEPALQPEPGRRLPVLKDLTKPPDPKVHCRSLGKDNVEKNVIESSNASLIVPDTQSQTSVNKIENRPALNIVKVAQNRETELVVNQKTDVKLDQDMKVKVELPQNEAQPTIYKADSQFEKPAVDLPTVSTATSPNISAANMAGNMPAGLPPHLLQAYLQYLSQTASDNVVGGQKAGMMGGLMPGLGMGMPLMTPFGNPLYSSMFPFGMNPLMMNPLMAMSAQSQQLPGQSTENPLSGQSTENQLSGQSTEDQLPGQTTVNQISEQNTTQHTVKLERKNSPDDFNQSENSAKDINKILPTLTGIKIEKPAEMIDIGSNQAPVKRMQIQENLPVSHLQTNSESGVSAHSSDNLSSEVQSVRVRRPSSKDQTATLRIPREPSVSSRLGGGQPPPVYKSQFNDNLPTSHKPQSSPEQDDPAVLKMSSSQHSSIQAWVDNNLKQIRTSLDGDPSVLDYEQNPRSVASTEKRNPNQETFSRQTAIVDTTDKSNQEKVRGWMGSGPNFLRVIHNTSYKGENADSIERMKPNLENNYLSGQALKDNHSQDLVKRTEVGSVSNKFGQSTYGNVSSDQNAEPSQTIKGRGGFGTPAMPKKTNTSEGYESVHTMNQQGQNPARLGFSTKSLSERFAGMRRGEGDGFSARKLPPRLQAQREKNQQVKDMISQLRKDTEENRQAS